MVQLTIEISISSDMFFSLYYEEISPGLSLFDKMKPGYQPSRISVRVGGTRDSVLSNLVSVGCRRTSRRGQVWCTKEGRMGLAAAGKERGGLSFSENPA